MRHCLSTRLDPIQHTQATAAAAAGAAHHILNQRGKYCDYIKSLIKLHLILKQPESKYTNQIKALSHSPDRLAFGMKGPLTLCRRQTGRPEVCLLGTVETEKHSMTQGEKP